MSTQPEPSMEEILASIRRIISEEDEDGEERDARSEKEGERPMAVEQEAEFDEDILEDDIDFVDRIDDDAPAAPPASSMLAESAAAAASSAFDSLARNLTRTQRESRTLEDLVVSALKPMLKDWLDTHLPTIVEEKVEEEIQRLARRRK